MLVDSFHVDSTDVIYTDENITSSYSYDTTELECSDDGKFTVRPQQQSVQFQTDRRVPKVGCAHYSKLLCRLSDVRGLDAWGGLAAIGLQTRTLTFAHPAAFGEPLCAARMQSLA
jgi:hypothetical protein